MSFNFLIEFSTVLWRRLENFDNNFYLQATCPPRGEKGLSYSEICEIVNERLSYHDMSPEGGCSEAFRASLSDFLIKNLAETLKRLREALLLGEEQYAGGDREYLENVALNISGITKKQLQVNRFRSSFSPFSRILGNSLLQL